MLLPVTNPALNQQKSSKSTVFIARRPLKALIFLVIAIIGFYQLYSSINNSPVSSRIELQDLTTDELEGIDTHSKTIDGAQCEVELVDKYGIMLDAGSTGTRVHIYQFSTCPGTNNVPVLKNEVYEQLRPGLSSYAGNPKAAAASIVPLLNTARETVPIELWSETPIAVKATAGLRLVERQHGAHAAEDILDEVRNLLLTYPFKLTNPKEDVSIMEGADEGVYAWVTINYLLGRLGQEDAASVGVMDLGGGSTQIVFEPKAELDSIKDASNKFEFPYGDKKYTLFQHSYLGYGLNEARRAINNAVAGSKTSAEHQCLLEGYENKFTSTNGQEVSFTGASSGFEGCHEVAKTIMHKEKQCTAAPCAFDGVHQPDLASTFDGNDMYIFSYFYDRTQAAGIDLPKELTVGQLRQTAEKVCGLNFPSATSPFTGSQEMGTLLNETPELCMDFTYMYTLLHDGYGMDDARPLKVVKKINNYETGWCLGAALKLIADM